jgi:hypothetical protein
MRSTTNFKVQAAIDLTSDFFQLIRPSTQQTFHGDRMKSIRLYLGFILLFFFTSNVLLAQQNPLNRRITLDIEKSRLDDALAQVEQQGRFSYSYNPKMLPLDSVLSLHVRNQQVRVVNEMLLGPRFESQSVGNHIVIRAAKPTSKIEEMPKNRDISGYLIDAVSGEKVRFATVFETAKRTSVLTDPQGHYVITVPGNLHQVELSFSKRGYRDTVVVVNPIRMGSLTVGLQPIPGFANPLASRPVTSVGLKAQESLPLVELFVPEKQRFLAENIEERLESFPFQISLVPAIGTNKLLSGGMDNNVSINILAGYANGVNGFEVGGLANIDRANVKGLQVGGLVNIVGGNLKGVQVGGILNYVKGEVNGMQVGGIMNFSPNPVNGIQIAGILNHVKADVEEVQIGGILNHGHNVGGIPTWGYSQCCKRWCRRISSRWHHEFCQWKRCRLSIWWYFQFRTGQCRRIPNRRNYKLCRR